MRNPFRRWFSQQNYHTTQQKLADELQVDRSYITILMRENLTTMPSLPLALALEKVTGGTVRPREMHDFVIGNKPKKEAA